ncbi:hypothetical protein [Streptomyces sp. NPDC006668]|uniref:hypothetical protein n=1 Tax=Streptomyces sp. NPDC006668 TaxID=3156903 RepID=UPI00340310E3
MDTFRRSQLVMEMLRHAANGNRDETMRVLVHIAQACDGQQMYNVCCGIADAARQSLIKLYGHPSPEGLWALAAPDPDEGCQHPAHTFALRFVSSYSNGDMETCSALYLAAYRASPADYGHSVTALIGLAGYLARAAAEELAANRDQPASHPH